jgi:hypothetical protein
MLFCCCSQKNQSMKKVKNKTENLKNRIKKEHSIDEAKIILSDFLKDSTLHSKPIVTQENNIKDTATLIRAVEPILFSKYGKEVIMNEAPYKINYINNYWIITGSLRGEDDKNSITLGGTFEVIVNPIKGDIVYLKHGK